jgi:hypothetical protein
MAHHAVLAAGVERLQNDQQRLVAVGAQQILQLCHALNVLLDRCLRRVVRFVLVFECRVNFAEPDLGAGIDDESLAVADLRNFSYRSADESLILESEASRFMRRIGRRRYDSNCVARRICSSPGKCALCIEAKSSDIAAISTVGSAKD